jgi:hypothetical protein
MGSMQHANHDAAATAQKLLDQELVPLAVAATITYHHVTDAARQVSETASLREIVHFAAVALSTVAPIYRMGPHSAPLSGPEIQELLFRPLEGVEPLQLDAYGVRRGDLRAALVTLKEARSAFGKP